MKLLTSNWQIHNSIIPSAYSVLSRVGFMLKIETVKWRVSVIL